VIEIERPCGSMFLRQNFGKLSSQVVPRCHGSRVEICFLVYLPIDDFLTTVESGTRTEKWERKRASSCQ
jgi:hypothetical protein